MTIPSERFRALQMAKSFMLDAANGRRKGNDMKLAARAALRHYPTEYELEMMARACPELLKAVE